MKRVMLALAGLVLVGGLTANSLFADQNHQITNANAVVWFEIPVVDMTRAMAFYSAVTGSNLELSKQSPIPMAMFPSTKNYGSAGALVQMPQMLPGANGPVIYLNGGDDLQVMLDRVVPAGGTILVPKTLISEEVGYYALFLDTEGNRLGLFSAK